MTNLLVQEVIFDCESVVTPKWHYTYEDVCKAVRYALQFPTILNHGNMSYVKSAAVLQQSLEGD